MERSPWIDCVGHVPKQAGGLVNIVLGLSANKSSSYDYAMYGFWVLILAIAVAFDPTGTRSKRMIAMAQMKQRGEPVVVDVARLFARPAATHRKRRGNKNFRGFKRRVVADGNPDGAGAGAGAGDADAAHTPSPAPVASATNSSSMMQQRWDCTLHAGGERVELHMPGAEQDFHIAGFSVRRPKRNSANSDWSIHSHSHSHSTGAAIHDAMMDANSEVNA